ncbi:MAG: cation-translocating P-type ATPase, partial [Anaerolineae bacterium]|nr:cation-translocating P-type ATPase [Anaerolineae bacterium]
MMELKITGMDCADCAATLEKGVGQLEGVQSCRVNYLTGQMLIEGHTDIASVTRRVQALGYGVADKNEKKAPVSEQRGGIAGFIQFMLERPNTAFALLGVAGLVVSMTLLLLEMSETTAHLIQAAIVVLIGFPIMRRGIQQFFFSRRVTINLLMTIATIGAAAIGEWSEAATVITLFAIGEALEGYSADRARHALHSLLTLAPQEALVIRPCINCAEHLGKDGYTGGPCPWCEPHEQSVPVEEVQTGETMLVLPASRIALDGRVLQGSSTVDQSHITGESIPVAKNVGDEVYAGSVNGVAVLHVEVTSLAQDSTLARIVRLVEDAQAKKSPTERFVDRFATYYTPAVIGIAILVALVPPVLFSGVFDTWLYRALALLVVACPCALVISTPVTVVSAMVRAAQNGILIKGGIHLETLAHIRAIAFDKTGTLTEGKPQVIEVTALNCTGEAVCRPCDDMLGLASAVERQSEHPLGRAVVQAAQKRGVLDRFAPAQEVAVLAGRGVQGQVAANPITIGSHAWFD